MFSSELSALTQETAMEEVCEGSLESSMESVLGPKASTAPAPTARGGGHKNSVTHAAKGSHWEPKPENAACALTPVTTKKETQTWSP